MESWNFSHLTKQDLSQIVELMLADVQKNFSQKSIKLEVTKAAKRLADGTRL